MTVLRTLKGTPIKRYKNLVGKQVGSQLYLHKNYVTKYMSPQIYKLMVEYLHKQVPNFKFNCMMIDGKNGIIRFDEAPDFDTAREPHVGNYVSLTPDGLLKQKGQSNSIWHHKWLWVMDDYKGFNIEESKKWSKLWLSKIPEVAKGTDKSWEEQLQKYGLR